MNIVLKQEKAVSKSEKSTLRQPKKEYIIINVLVEIKLPLIY